MMQAAQMRLVTIPNWTRRNGNEQQMDGRKEKAKGNEWKTQPEIWEALINTSPEAYSNIRHMKWFWTFQTMPTE